MTKTPKPSPTEFPVLFEIDPEPAQERLTALGGLPLVARRFARWGCRGV